MPLQWLLPFAHLLVLIARLVIKAWLSAPGLCGLYCILSLWPFLLPSLTLSPGQPLGLSFLQLAWPSSNTCYVGPNVCYHLYGSCVSDILTKNPAQHPVQQMLSLVSATHSVFSM